MPRKQDTEKPAITVKQQKFISFYLGEARGNGAKAALLAGYAEKDAANTAYRLLHHSEIRGEIDRRLTEDAMSSGEVLHRLTEHARASLGDFLTFAEDSGKWTLDLKAAADAGKLHLLKSIEPKEFGIKLDLVDSQAALVHLGRYHKLFVDKAEIGFDSKGLPPALLALGGVGPDALKEMLEDARRELRDAAGGFPVGSLANGAGDLRPAGS